jgi:hypothetical protein
MANGRSGSQRKRLPLTGAKAQSFYIDAAGVAGGISDYLDALGDAVKEAIRPAAYAGAKVIYDRVKMNVAGMGRVTGNLDSAIYHAHMPEHSTPGKREMYRVSWNVIKAPHGRLLEHGWVQKYKVYMRDGKWFTNKNAPLETPKQHPGYGFILRAHAALPEAQAAMLEELNKRLQALSYYGA